MERDEWQRPGQVVAALALRATDTVIDLGAGFGYFARWIAPRVARLIAVDPSFVEELRRNGFEAVASLRELRDPVDLVFAANVLRLLDSEDLGRIEALTPRLVVIDWKPGTRPVGPSEAMSLEEIASLFPRFEVGPMHDFLPYQWMIELRKP